MDRKRREFSNSQDTLCAWVIEKTKKGYLFLPFITYIIICELQRALYGIKFVLRIF